MSGVARPPKNFLALFMSKVVVFKCLARKLLPPVEAAGKRNGQERTTRRRGNFKLCSKAGSTIQGRTITKS